MKINDQKLNQRLNQHYLSDGLMEIIAGGWLIFFAIMYLIVLQQGLPIYYAQMTMMLLPLAMGPGIRFLKKHFTDQRIGYVKHSRKLTRERSWILIIAVSMLMLMFFGSVLVVLRSQAVDKGLPSPLFVMLPLIMCGFIAFGYFYMAIQYGMPRLFIPGMLIVAVGLTMTWLQLPYLLATVFTLSSVGLITLLSGCITFAQFLHNHSVGE